MRQSLVLQSVSQSVCQLVSQAVGRSVIQSASEILIGMWKPSLHETVQCLLKGRSVSQIINNYVSPFFSEKIVIHSND